MRPPTTEWVSPVYTDRGVLTWPAVQIRVPIAVRIYPICDHDWDTTKKSPTYNFCLRCDLRLGELAVPRTQAICAAMAVDEASARRMEPGFIAILIRIHRRLAHPAVQLELPYNR